MYRGMSFVVFLSLSGRREATFVQPTEGLLIIKNTSPFAMLTRSRSLPTGDQPFASVSKLESRMRYQTDRSRYEDMTKSRLDRVSQLSKHS
jgi:hypothetical protein